MSSHLRRGIPAAAAAVLGLVACGDETPVYPFDASTGDAGTRDDAGTDPGTDAGTDPGTDAGTGNIGASAATEADVARWANKLCQVYVDCYAGYATLEECIDEYAGYIREDLAAYAALSADCDAVNIAYWTCANDKSFCGEDGYISSDCGDEFLAIEAADCSGAFE